MRQQVEKYIDYLIQNKTLLDKDIYVFGANAMSMLIIDELLTKGYTVTNVLDNNPNMQGKSFMEAEIMLPNKVLAPYFDNRIILIASRYYAEMKKQLETLGYRENKHIFQVINLNRNSDFNLSKETFKKYEKMVIEGLEVYNRLSTKYDAKLIMMSPAKPNGDIYIISSYINKYIEQKHNGEKYIFTVVGKSCELTAKLFKINNIGLISLEENDHLVALANILPEYIKVLNPYYNNKEIYHHLDCYNGLTFIEEIKHGLLDLPNGTKPEFPKVTNEIEGIASIIEQYDIVKGSSVIIAPHANSIPLIKSSFWEVLVEVLKENGYKVFTNCGTPDETPIKGSEGIYFSFENAVAISEYAGTVISYRSGFCEIIASSKCKKIIIYPDHLKGHSTLRVLFAMEDEIYEQDQLYQITNTFEDTIELLDEVLKYVGK